MPITKVLKLEQMLSYGTSAAAAKKSIKVFILQKPKLDTSAFKF